jgi:Tfp pilus assembly protein PilF
MEWLAVLGIMAGLYGVDRALERLEIREVRTEAWHHYQNGLNLVNEHKPVEAVDEFRHAHTLDRLNRDFDIGLAGAQLTAGRPEDAEETLNEILARNSNDGRANFLMARVRLAQNRFDDAISFYHRAIYGSWGDGSIADKTDARLELAGQLARRGRSEELLSELLLLDSAKGSDVARKVAGLYLEAGSTARAETAYRDILRTDPNDAEAWDGLGEAELKRGEFRGAHAAFEAAVRLGRGDTSKVALADRLATLDPTLRRMSSAEKFRRSSEILGMVEAEIADCPKVGSLQDLLAQSAKLRSEKLPGTPSNEAAETRLELAGQIWKARLQACAAQPAADDPLAILIRKIEQ